MIIELILLAIIGYFACNYLMNPHRALMPPGEFGLPIIGKFPPRDKNIMHYIAKYRKQYGDIFSYKIGSRTFVVVSNYQLTKQAFYNPALADRPDFYTIMTFALGRPLGVISNIGVPWHNTRRFTTRFLKDMGMGKSSYIPKIEYEAKCLVKDFKNHLNKKMELPWSLNVAVLNVTWQLTTNTRYEVSDKKAQDVQKMINEMFDSFHGIATLIDVLPWLVHVLKGPLRKLSGLSLFHERIDDMYKFLRGVVADSRANKDPDAAYNIVKAYDEEMANSDSDYGSTFNDEDLLVVLADLFTTGSDSTATTIKWIILFIAKYPEVRKKMQAEIDAHIPLDRLPQYEDKENLPYTYAVYQEVMRLMPLLLNSIPHCASRDTTLGNYKIPKGTIVLGSILMIHKDPKYWKKPNEFYPEHFLNEDGSLKNVSEGFLPFSYGRRSCIGELLARIQIFLMVTSLVQNYDFHEIPEEPLDVMTLHPTHYVFNLPTGHRLTITERART